MQRHAPLFVLLLLFLITPKQLSAQLTDSDRLRLVDEIQAAAQQIDPDRFPAFESSKSQLLASVDAAKAFFRRNASAQDREDWYRYLDLDPLIAAAGTQGSTRALARESIALRQRLIGTSPGLELPALRRLRDSAGTLIEALRYQNKERGAEYLKDQLQKLSDRVGQLDSNPTADDYAAVSALVSMVSASGQADAMLRSMRNTFSRPNVAVLVGEPLVQSAIQRNVNENRPVNDCILGTRIVGHANLCGVVTANLLPATGAARVNVMLTGHVTSRNRGYNGPVRLRTLGLGDVNVSRQVTFNESHVSLSPAHTQASLRTEIQAIEHKSGLVRKIAKKRAAQQKPQADRIALAKLRNQVGSQFEQDTNEASSIKPPDAFAEIRPVLQRLALNEPSRFWSSTEDAVLIDATFRRQDQLASVVSRPPISEPFDAAIQIHESVIDNAFTPVLAGRDLKGSQLDELLEKAGRPAQSAEEMPPFEIRFSRSRPLIFEARDNQLRVGIRGTRFAEGNRELREAMEITALYSPADVGRRKHDADPPGRRRSQLSQRTSEHQTGGSETGDPATVL